MQDKRPRDAGPENNATILPALSSPPCVPTRTNIDLTIDSTDSSNNTTTGVTASEDELQSGRRIRPLDRCTASRRMSEYFWQGLMHSWIAYLRSHN